MNKMAVVAVLLACAFVHEASAHDSASVAKYAPSPLLAIDKNRATVIERIVAQWGEPLAQSSAALSPEQLRTMLSGLRSDHLLAASLAGNLDGLRKVLANALTSTDVKASLVQPKVLGDPSDDLVYTPVVPCRILDTRYGTAPPYNAPMVGGSAFPVAANLSTFAPQGGSATNCSLPTSFSAIAVVFTVLNPNFDAFLAASNSSDFATLTRSVVMDFSANKGLANTAIVPVDGTVTFYLGLPASVTTNVIADAVGYFRPPGGQYFMQGGNLFGATAAVLGNLDFGQPLEIYAGGNRAMRLEFNVGSPNVIAGSDANLSNGGGGRTIAGGGYPGSSCADVGGGLGSCINQTVGDFATVAGGLANVAGGYASTIGGGYFNESSTHIGTTISGGYYNAANQPYSTVSGGYGNYAAGAYSMIPGGLSNRAMATVAFAAGYKAIALENGEFVWADDTNADFDPSLSPHGWGNGNAINTFNVRASGGIWFVTGLDPSNQPASYVYVSPGSGTWAGFSDRAAKENFRAIDTRQIVEKIAAMPIETWNYIAEGAQVRHLGPVSQDFWAAFGLGPNDKTITHIDEGGVALAAIQGLNAKLEAQIAEKNARIGALEARMAELEALRSELASLKAMLEEMREGSAPLVAR